jgi:hypothetical protein
MTDFATPRDLAQSFIKAYYTKFIYEVEQLYQFYASDASITRRGVVHNVPISIKATNLLSLGLPPGSFLTVGNYTAIPRGGAVFLTVAGTVDVNDDTHHFTQSFMIEPIDGKHWITLDVLVLFDDEFTQAASHGGSYRATVAGELEPQSPRDEESGTKRPPGKDGPQGRKKGKKARQPPDRKGGKKSRRTDDDAK